MDELIKFLNLNGATAVLGGLLGGLAVHLIHTLLDHRLKRELEQYKNTLNILSNRLDFLHQEQGKAALNLIRSMKQAKMHVKQLIHPLQQGSNNQEHSLQNAHDSCLAAHNLIADTSFLFPPELEELMIKTRSKLEDIYGDSADIFCNAKEKCQSPFNEPAFGKLHIQLKNEYEPLEQALIQQIRTAIGVQNDT